MGGGEEGFGQGGWAFAVLGRVFAAFAAFAVFSAFIVLTFAAATVAAAAIILVLIILVVLTFQIIIIVFWIQTRSGGVTDMPLSSSVASVLFVVDDN